MTLEAALKMATAQLTVASIDTPRLDAQLILAWVIEGRREDLIRDPERVLTERERVIFEKAVALRALRRPLPYLTGEAYFYGRAFKVNRAVLIPRPETEMLVTAALARTRTVTAPRIADIGTGSGCLAVTLAAERPAAHVWATDLSPLALRVARKNIVRYDVTDQVTLAQGDLMTPLPSETPFDVIVSNPPYITEQEIAGLMPEVRDYEPTLALSGESDATGEDGTRLHRRLIADAKNFLTPGGWLLLEVGQGQADQVATAAQDHGYTEVTTEDDFAGIARIVCAHWQ